MKEILIITAAGTSSRFSKSIGKETLKCIYSEPPYNKTILEILLGYVNTQFDNIFIVGGYKFDYLQQYVTTHFNKKNIILVCNDHYADYKDNYSLYLGITEALRISEGKANIVYAEGDLILDKPSFNKVCASNCCVITSNNDPIYANKAVIFYQTMQNTIKYLYDPNHSELFIPEPFTFIANSGQVWKFTQADILQSIVQSQDASAYKYNNPKIIQEYFFQLKNNQYKIINFQQWYNCNTVDDYRNAFQKMTNEKVLI